MIVGPEQVAAVARALDVDPESVRADTPLASIGWTGSAGEWAVVGDHLGLPIREDPPVGAVPNRATGSDREVSTIGELVAIVETVHRRASSGN